MSKIAMLVSAFKSIDRGSSKQKLPRDPPLLLCVHRVCRNIGRRNKLPFLPVSLHYRSRNAVLNAVQCENQYHYYCLDYYFFFVRLLYVYRTCMKWLVAISHCQNGHNSPTPFVAIESLIQPYWGRGVHLCHPYRWIVDREIFAKTAKSRRQHP